MSDCDNVELKFTAQSDSDLAVIAFSAGPLAAEEVSSALIAGSSSYPGQQSSVFPTSEGTLAHTLSCVDDAIVVAAGPLADLENAARGYTRLGAKKADDKQRERQVQWSEMLALCPDRVVLHHLNFGQACRATLRVSPNGREVVVTVEATTTKLTRSFMREPPSWRNADPFDLLLCALDMAGARVVPLSTRAFFLTAYSLPILLVLGLLTVTTDLAIATGVAGIGLGFVFHQPWSQYVDRVREHVQVSDEQRRSPWTFLLRRAWFYGFGVMSQRWRTDGCTRVVVEFSTFIKATSPCYEGVDPVRPIRQRAVTRIRRPRYFWHRFVARRWATWRARRVAPVYGSFPPEWTIMVSGRPLIGLLARTWCGYAIWSVKRLLLWHGACDRLSVDVVDRFASNYQWRTGRFDPSLHTMTENYNSRLLGGLIGTMTVTEERETHRRSKPIHRHDFPVRRSTAP